MVPLNSFKIGMLVWLFIPSVSEWIKSYLFFFRTQFVKNFLFPQHTTKLPFFCQVKFYDFTGAETGSLHPI